MEHLRDEQAERLVLRLALERPDRAEEAGLEPGDFWDARHGLWWGALLALVALRQPVTEETLVQRLSDARALERAGGPEYLEGLLLASGSLVGFGEQVARVKDRSTRRKALEALEKAATALRDVQRGAAEVAGAAADQLASLGAEGAEEPQHIRAVTSRVVADMEAASRGELSTYIRTGIRPLDAALGGLPCGNLVMLGAQPRVGKSGVLLTAAFEMAAGSRGEVEAPRPAVPTLVFSLEDPADWLPRRALALYARASLRGMRTGELSEWQALRVREEARRISTLPLWVVDSEGMTAQKAVAIARRMVRRHGVRAVLVDHLLELVADAESSRLARDERIGAAVGALRDLAKNTRTPDGQPIAVMVAAHFSRPERRDEDPKYAEPHLSSFAGSAYVERRARVALGLYRPRPPEPLADDATPIEREQWQERADYSERTLFCKVLKQTEGQEGCDFAMQLYAPAGAVDPRLGGPLNDKGGFTPAGDA